MPERTLVIIKPDAVMKGVVEKIKERYVAQGLRIVEDRHTKLTESQARNLYKTHEGRPFFEGLILSMISGPSVALIIEGEDAVQTVRFMNGATDPAKAEPGTIRHDFRSAGGPFNTVHGSDSQISAEMEIRAVMSVHNS